MTPEPARTNLDGMIADFVRDLARLAPKDACARLDWLRRQAVLDGFIPTAVLADGLANALARHGKAVSLGPWIEALQLAGRCGADNADAGPLLLATVGVRYAA